MNRRLRAGFTLVELLVVMAIIAVLVSLVITVVQNVRENAQIAATRATLEVVISGIDSYRAEYLRNPPVFYDWTIEPGMATPETAASVLRRNEVLYQWLTERFDAIGKGTATGPFLTSDKIKYTGDLDGNALVEFCDSWGEPLVFIMPGVDHRGEVDGDGNKIPAADNTTLQLTAAPGQWDVDTEHYDLYSLGPNGIDDTKLATSTLTTFDKNADSYKWGAKSTAYDGIKTSAPGTGDDIGSWKWNSKKSSNN